MVADLSARLVPKSARRMAVSSFAVAALVGQTHWVPVWMTGMHAEEMAPARWLALRLRPAIVLARWMPA